MLVSPEMVTEHRGFMVPAADTECRKVVFDTTTDMTTAIRLCRSTDLVLQAGGNFGVWPEHLTTYFSKVVTCEPDPLNFHCLKHNVNDRVEAIRCALGDETNLVSLKREEKNAGAHFVEYDDREGIPMLTIDSLMLPKCDYICLDIEGFELLALKGGYKTIEKFHPVIQIEDKGLSTKYGIKQGDAERWLHDRFGYNVVERIHRDVILA